MQEGNVCFLKASKGKHVYSLLRLPPPVPKRKTVRFNYLLMQQAHVPFLGERLRCIGARAVSVDWYSFRLVCEYVDSYDIQVEEQQHPYTYNCREAMRVVPIEPVLFNLPVRLL